LGLSLSESIPQVLLSVTISAYRITLEVVQGPHLGQRWTFNRALRVTLGRRAPAHIRLGQESAMSIQHCELVFDPPLVTVVDLSSTNGTMVNGIPVAEAVLADGDEVGVGETVIRVAIEVPAEQPEAALRAGESGDHTQVLPSPRVFLSRPPTDVDRDPQCDARPLPTQLPSSFRQAAESTAPDTTIPLNSPNNAAIIATQSGFSDGEARRSGADTGGELPEFCGPYKIEKRIGEGGMAIVFLARHGKTGQRVAVKLIRASNAPQKLVQLFAREASVLLRLKHPRIVRAIEFGFQDQQPFLALEWLPVIDLLGLIDPLPPTQKIRTSCWVVSRILQGLDFAHREGFVHRDVKPSNILAYRDRHRLQVKLGDFGLAKCFQDAGLTAMTDDYSLRGTLAYMSPEQMRDSRSVGPKSDIFSAGACLYRMVTGRHPKLTARGVEPEMDVIRAANLPRALATLLTSSLHVAMEQRPETAAKMHDLLQPFHGK